MYKRQVVTLNEQEVERFAAPIDTVLLIGSSFDDSFNFDDTGRLFDGDLRVQVSAGPGIDTVQLAGQGQLLDLERSVLESVEIIDIRGSGENELKVAAQNLASTVVMDATLRVLANPNDRITLSDQPEITGTYFDEGGLVVAIQWDHGARMEVQGMGATNPVNPADVDTSGSVSALDALLIINELHAMDSNGGHASVKQSQDRDQNLFFDVSGDGTISVLDVLRIINLLNEPTHESEPDHAPITRKNYFIQATPIDQPIVLDGNSNVRVISFESPVVQEKVVGKLAWTELVEQQNSELKNPSPNVLGQSPSPGTVAPEFFTKDLITFIDETG